MCAGYGGIGLGLKNIFGERMRTLAYCELEGFAQANLVSKMEAGFMDVAPIWNDLKTFPYESFNGLVDILIAGYPCQPFSAAGKRAGKEDPRHLWPWIADGIRLLRPRLCFFENVEGHISLGLREVIGELESIGYKAAWGIFSAREVGAPHQRKRVFILAVANSSRAGSWSTYGCGGFEAWSSCLQQERQTDGYRSEQASGYFEQAGCGELANPSDGSNSADGHAEAHRLQSKHWEEVCSRESGGANATAWEGLDKWHTPSEQTEFVGADSGSGCQRSAWPSRPGEPQHGWEPPKVVANHHGPHAGHGEQRPERELGDLSGGCGEAMGNAAEQGCQRSGRTNDPSWTIDRPTESNGSCAYGAMEQSQRQAEPSLGRDPHGPAGGMDYAQL